MHRSYVTKFRWKRYSLLLLSCLFTYLLIVARSLSEKDKQIIQERILYKRSVRGGQKCDKLRSGNVKKNSTDKELPLISIKIARDYLVVRHVVNGVPEIFADGYVDFEAGESPRDEGDLAVLGVEREILDVERAVGGQQCRIHPQHASVTRHNSVRHHVFVELLSGANNVQHYIANVM